MAKSLAFKIWEAASRIYTGTKTLADADAGKGPWKPSEAYIQQLREEVMGSKVFLSRNDIDGNDPAAVKAIYDTKPAYEDNAVESTAIGGNGKVSEAAAVPLELWGPVLIATGQAVELLPWKQMSRSRTVKLQSSKKAAMSKWQKEIDKCWKGVVEIRQIL